MSAQLRNRSEFQQLWDALDVPEQFERIADSAVVGDRLTDALLARLADGDSIDRLLVELVGTPSFIAATGTAP